MKSKMLSLFHASALVLCLSACDNSSDPGTAAVDAQVISTTDLGVINQGAEHIGRDGGFSGTVGGQTAWVFGDTVIRTPNAAGQTWLSNSWSITTDTDASDGLDTMQSGTDASGQPGELFDFTNAEHQFNVAHSGNNCIDPCGARWALWPGPVVRDEPNQRAILFYGKIHAEPGVLNFRGVGQSIAFWPDDQARPQRQTFNVVDGYPTMLFDENEPAYGHAALSHNNYVYAYACSQVDFDKPCKLARVSLDNIMDKSRWQYYASNKKWSSDQSTSAKLFFGNGIMSVDYNAYLDRFVAVYNPPASRKIAMRTAPLPEGPWSQELIVADAMPSTNTNGWVYDALAHSEFEEASGRRIYITYTRQNESDVREMRLLSVELDKP